MVFSSMWNKTNTKLTELIHWFKWRYFIDSNDVHTLIHIITTHPQPYITILILTYFKYIFPKTLFSPHLHSLNDLLLITDPSIEELPPSLGLNFEFCETVDMVENLQIRRIMKGRRTRRKEKDEQWREVEEQALTSLKKREWKAPDRGKNEEREIGRR